MKWYQPICCLLAGAFLANMVPHLVQGMSGDRFPSPFADPPGKGLSSPTVNVIWGLANLVVGYLLFRAGKVQSEKWWGLLLFFVGIAGIGVMLSTHFAQKAQF